MEDSLEQRLLAYMSRSGYEPQDRSAIARGMGVSSEERAALRELISRWEQGRKLLRLRGARYVPAAAVHSSYEGVVRVSLKNGAKVFVPGREGQRVLAPMLPEDAEQVEIPLERGRCMGAMDGDVVRAAVVRSMPPPHLRRKKCPRPSEVRALALTARVEEVLRRRHELWLGVLRMEGRQPLARGDGRSAPRRMVLSRPLPAEARSGMLVSVQPLSVPTEGGAARGRVAEVLGWPDAPGVDMAALMCRYSLRSEFPAKVETEARALPAAPLPEEKTGREDWTARCVVTIDPPDAKDFDDAISLVRTADGWELGVHIADVSHYVRPGSALDAEARRRGNSTYLPDRVLHMLPPSLSDHLCSLVQGEDRLTMLCHMCFSADGEVQHTRLARAVICSRKRLDYPSVLALLEQGSSTGDAEVDAMLLEAHKLAQLLSRKRIAAGAMELNLPELRAVLDASGRAVDFVREEGDAAHSLIAEFMLAANEQVARLLRRHDARSVYRTHEEPAPDKWQAMADTLREYGVCAAPQPSRLGMMQVLEGISGHPEEQRLQVIVLRAMMRAQYAAKPLGHFGLAKADYCHFTSPIRRYADLVVHRAVVRMLHLSGAAAAPSFGELETLAEHLSDTERQSAAAEMEGLRLKLLQYMEEQVCSPTPRRWLAIVTGVWERGIAVEVEELMLRGVVPSSRLPIGWYWRYSSGGGGWSCGEQLIAPGARLWVQPYSIDWQGQLVSFDYAGDSE